MSHPIESQPVDALAVPVGCSSVRIYRNGEFRGSGMVLAPRVIVTCVHVICPGWSQEHGWPRSVPSMSLHVRVDSGATVAVAQIVRDHEFCDQHGHDWVALRTAAPVCAASSVLLVHVRSKWLEHFSGRLEVEGFRYALRRGAARGLSLKGKPWTESDRVVRGQVDGALSEGISGAPLSVRLRGGSAVVGMLVLGGIGKGQSDFIGSDLMVELARREGLEPRVIDARGTKPAVCPRWPGLVRLGSVGAAALVIAGDAPAIAPPSAPASVAPTISPSPEPERPTLPPEPSIAIEPQQHRAPVPPPRMTAKPRPEPCAEAWSRPFEEMINDPCIGIKP